MLNEILMYYFKVRNCIFHSYSMIIRSSQMKMYCTITTNLNMEFIAHALKNN